MSPHQFSSQRSSLKRLLLQVVVTVLAKILRPNREIQTAPPLNGVSALVGREITKAVRIDTVRLTPRPVFICNHNVYPFK